MNAKVLDLDGRRILLNDLDRMVWPEDGLTKGDLVDYHIEVAGRMVPFLANRPLGLLRGPEPTTGDFVYQRSAPAGLPGWIPTRRVRAEHAAGGYAVQVIGSDRAALVYLTNLGYVSAHPWACTVDAPERPDQLLLDLDPTDIAFREVRNAALLVRELLAAHRIRAWVKTSGGRGLHVVVPLGPTHTFEQVRAAAEAVTRMARAREPSLFTLDMRRARRRGKILIDVHRNHRGATLVAPYAVRELRGAPVATPLEWAELERPLYPEEFTLATIRERLRRVGDPMRDFFAAPQSLGSLLRGGRLRRARPLA